MVLAIGAVLVAALVVRQSTTREARRRLLIVAGVALGVRLLAVTVVYFNAIRTHGEGTWLNDEASFYLAAESLFHDWLDRPLPQGLGHLGGNAYLGLTTAITVAEGHMDTVAYRLANATLGTLVAVLACIVAARIVGPRAALVAGIVVAVWPTLVLWSATMLRDTLGSFVVVVVWWTLVFHRRAWEPRVLGVVALALVLLAGLRPYLGAAVAAGFVCWATVPFLARRSKLTLVVGSTLALIACAGVVVLEARRIDQIAHDLLYRQTTTRLETLGRLYYDLDPNSPPVQPPFGPGTPVVLVDKNSGWLLAGSVKETLGPGMVSVSFTDGSIQPEPTADLVLLQGAPLTPLQILASFGPGLLSFVDGSPGSGDASSLAWTADAIIWDVLFVLALVGGIRARIPVREWLFPACVILGTVAALVSVPGAPGNDDRHRSTQAVPLLAVFAVGLLASRPRLVSTPEPPDTTATSSPPRARTLTAS